MADEQADVQVDDEGLNAKVEQFLDSLADNEREAMGYLFQAANQAPKPQGDDDDDDVQGYSFWGDYSNDAKRTTCFYSCLAAWRSSGFSWTYSSTHCDSYCRRRYP